MLELNQYIMRTLKQILLIVFYTIEIMAIILFVSQQIKVLPFILITSSMSLSIGLYFYDKNVSKKNSN